jgi:UDP-N-acetyl-D-galactosamine dehydrogenase
VVVLGLTFKEDCPDLRNSRVIDVIHELESYGAEVYVHDPIADPAEAMHEYGVRLRAWEELPPAAAIVGAVAHRPFKERPLSDFLAKLLPDGVIADVKSQFDPAALAARDVTLWRL